MSQNVEVTVQDAQHKQHRRRIALGIIDFAVLPSLFSSAMNVVQRARESGKCPPSLISDDRAAADGGFEAAVLSVLEGQSGLILGTDSSVASRFTTVIEMADGVNRIPDQVEEGQKSSVLEYRRCIILTIVGTAPSSNASLNHILANGFLLNVKSWLVDILSSSVGAVDLLLHMLSMVSELPVTKDMVVSSGLGKAIGAVTKHKICIGSKNEAVIKEKVQKVKDDWNASVKARKGKNNGSEKVSKKRLSDEQTNERSPAKKAKTASSFSSLLQKVSSTESPPIAEKAPEGNGVAPSMANAVQQVKQDLGTSSVTHPTEKKSNEEANVQAADANKKAVAKRVKWADHFGGSLEASREIESSGTDAPHGEDGVSWSDRRKRDRLREKELLAKAKRSKIIDDDDEMIEAATMKITAPWRQPKMLTGVDVPELKSSDAITQATRLAATMPARYLSEADVPRSPAPLSDVDQAADLASQSSTVAAVIPFFAPPPAPVPAPAPVAEIPPQQHIPPVLPTTSFSPLPVPNATVGGATSETVAAMGLPTYLAGSNLQVLQTVVSTPGLLKTFVDSNGLYDQTRLMSLVQTMTQSMAPAQPASTLGGFQQPAGVGNTVQTSYQPAQSSSHYGPSSGRSGYRGDQNNSENNLHVSGYGLTTTQSDIVALFTPYVKVDEVVMKSGFSFVNTSDPAGAKRAREALNGALLGGSPIRINVAQRRNRESAPSFSASSSSRVMPAPRNSYGQIDLDQVRDDRGNPATKNLFVAGYGPGTSEQELRNIFSQHASITGCVMKGTFSFVNTTDKPSAVSAREALSGSMVNGGVLRINFAKETGRLGTSFDTTYGTNTRSPYARPVSYS